MKCEKCGTDVALTARFCTNCGNKIEEELRKGGDVDLAWLRSIVKKLGYEPHPTVKDTDERIFCVHPGRFNLILRLAKGFTPPLITMEMAFQLSNKAHRDIQGLLSQINKANVNGGFATLFLSENSDGLGGYSFIILTSQISDRDIMQAIERFDDEVRLLIKTHGLATHL
jgi:hypothetical protein